MDARTHDISRLDDQLWDAIVVGAGPAGSVAAHELARRGCSVLLVEKFSLGRPKVCGGCLSGVARRQLAALGLDDIVAGAVPIDSFLLSCAGRHGRIGVRGQMAIAREQMDASLVKAAQAAGAQVVYGVTAHVAECAADRRWVQLATTTCQARVAARIVIWATGLGKSAGPTGHGRRSPRAGELIGAGAMLSAAAMGVEPGTIQMAVGPGGYVGMVRLSDGRINVAAALSRQLVATAGGPGGGAAHILGLAGREVPGELSQVDWLGTPAMPFRTRQVAAPRLLAIGDAAGYEEPFTGEGMAWAVQSACAAVEYACQAIEHYEPELPVAWSTAHRRLLGRRMQVCGLIGKALRSYPLARAATAVLCKAPWLARPLVNSIERGRPRQASLC